MTPEEALDHTRRGVPGGEPLTNSARTRALQAHLDECARCRMVVAEAARAAAGTSDAAAGPFRTLADGEQLLGRYQIRRFIARGGMGEVYEAFDSVLNETVALKTLLPTALDDERAVVRLLEEVRLARRVTDRNVCRILEFGTYQQKAGSGGGIPFLTMELLAGEPLARRLARDGALPLASVRRFVEGVAAGLQAIHAAGIVHRDFKSENVFLVSDGSDQRAVVMDFGLARGPREDLLRFSSTGAAGTPDYMAPEQVEGKPPTPAFDIYALGIVMFEMLTGKKPFAGASPYLTALSRLQQPAPAPSELRAGLPAAWDAVVARCLAREPERRFARVEEIVRALDAPGAHAPPAARRWRIAAGVAALLVASAAWVAVPRPRRGVPLVSSAAPAAAAPPTAAPASTATHPAPASIVPAVVPPEISGARAPRRNRRESPPAKSPGPLPTAPAPDLLRDAQALMLDGEVARACAMGEQAAVSGPARPEVELFLGKCFVRLGKPEVARRHYRRYLEIAPADAPDLVFVRGMVDGAK